MADMNIISFLLYIKDFLIEMSERSFSSSAARCGLCGGEPVGLRVMRCGHNFCARCLADHLETLREYNENKNGPLNNPTD